MKAKRPHWSLATVQHLSREGRVLISRTRAQAFFPDPVTAMSTTRTVIAELDVKCFAHTLRQLDVCDVYGVRIAGQGWYLKLTVTQLLVVVSLHPLEHPLRTNGGEVLP